MVDPGWSRQSSVNRYTANLNANYNIFKRLSFNMISSASYRQQRAPGTLSSDVDVVSGEVKRDFDINPYSYALNTSRVLDPNEYYTRNYADFNILHELENNYMDFDVVDLKFQGEFKLKPVAGLELSALGAVKYSSTAQQHTITDYSNQAMAYRAMPTTTIRDSSTLIRIIHMHSLSQCFLTVVSMRELTSECFLMTSVQQLHITRSSTVATS